MTKHCDNKSAGIVLRDSEGNFALMKRAKFPYGYAPSAGHIDDFGTPENAAIQEMREELGIYLKKSDLKQTDIYGLRVDKKCRRPGGDHHVWYVFEAEVAKGNKIKPDADETRGADWYTHKELQTLADRTKAYLNGEVLEEDWQNNPGLEEVWVDFMLELGHINL